MKTIKYIVSLALVLCGTTSCSDFLDKEPHELTPETYFNTETELNDFLLGVYSPLMQEYFYGNSYPITLAGGDDLTFYQRSSPVASIVCANANSGTADIMTFWKILYEGINRANMMLENADKNAALDVAVRNRAKAEALFMRGFYYFNLVQGWGDVPLRSEATKKVEGLSIPRTDKQEVYNLLIEDMKNAIPNLPTSDQLNHTGTVTQSAAQGILARVYLFRAGEHYRDNKPAGSEVAGYFEQAKHWAEQAKNSGLHGLVKPYSQVFLDMCADKYNSKGVRESMWEVEMAGNRISSANFTAGRAGNVYGFGCTVDHSSSEAYRNYTGMKNPGYGYRFAYASLKLYDMYEAAGDTARANWNIAPYEYKLGTGSPQPVTGRLYFSGKRPANLTTVDGMPCEDYPVADNVNKTFTRCAAKYRREHEVVTPKNKNYTPINFPILRYSDVLLMLAEAENEINGPTTLAYECINKVRERANLEPLAGLDKAGFREALKDERAMELCFEATRRWDLVRWGEFYTKMQEMVSYTMREGWNSGHRYAAEYYKVTPAYVYFPIPDAERAANKDASQNPGW